MARYIDADALIKAIIQMPSTGDVFDCIERQSTVTINDLADENKVTKYNHIAEDSKKVSFSCGPENGLIDRRQAIDAINSHFGFNIEEEYGSAVQEVINGLPSAQPEQKCVNCGRTVNNGGWYEDGRTRCPIEEHYALPKDGYCHLWEREKTGKTTT